jgi:hypothetical protein
MFAGDLVDERLGSERRIAIARLPDLRKQLVG